MKLLGFAKHYKLFKSMRTEKEDHMTLKILIIMIFYLNEMKHFVS
jgi:hypothetical protein